MTSNVSFGGSVIDPLLHFSEQRTVVFNQTVEQFEKQSPQWERANTALEGFEIQVRTRGSDFQHVKVQSPGNELLEKERQTYLTTYWEFKATCEKIGVFSTNISKTIQFLTPIPRSYADEQRLNSDHPVFLQEIKKNEEVCKQQIAELGELFTQTNTLKDKMVQFLNNNVAWSVQRFCQIVDNQGKPINTWTRLVDRVTTPVIPKPLNNTTTSSISLTEPNKNQESAKKEPETTQPISTSLALPAEISLKKDPVVVNSTTTSSSEGTNPVVKQPKEDSKELVNDPVTLDSGPLSSPEVFSPVVEKVKENSTEIVKQAPHNTSLEIQLPPEMPHINIEQSKEIPTTTVGCSVKAVASSTEKITHSENKNSNTSTKSTQKPPELVTTTPQ